jgi:hypothetical protein
MTGISCWLCMVGGVCRRETIIYFRTDSRPGQRTLQYSVCLRVDSQKVEEDEAES